MSISEGKGFRREMWNLTIQELFITNLKAYRKLCRISQVQLADLCDSSSGYIGELETGRRFPSADMIERIAGALGIESWHLFKNEPISLSNAGPSVRFQTGLAPTQKDEFMKMANSALAKILDNF